MAKGKSFGFGDAVDQEEKLIPEGVYIFSVTKMDKAEREAGKLGKCYCADLTLALKAADTDDDTTYEFSTTIFLHESVKWKFLHFFAAIGQRKHGDKGAFLAKWDKVQGADGICVIGVRPAEGKYRARNELESWGRPEDAAASNEVKF